VRLAEEATDLVTKTFEHWMVIARGLEIGYQVCRRDADIGSQVQRGHEGAAFARTYNQWLAQHPKLARISPRPQSHKVIRSWLYKCLTHEAEIIAWRKAQGWTEQARYNYPQTVFERWAREAHPELLPPSSRLEDRDVMINPDTGEEIRLARSSWRDTHVRNLETQIREQRTQIAELRQELEDIYRQADPGPGPGPGPDPDPEAGGDQTHAEATDTHVTDTLDPDSEDSCEAHWKALVARYGPKPLLALVNWGLHSDINMEQVLREGGRQLDWLLETVQLAWNDDDDMKAQMDDNRAWWQELER
jgi:hypothetical protein